jgi:hypothetical protein
MSEETIRLWICLTLVGDFLHVMCTKCKQKLVLNFIFDLL